MYKQYFLYARKYILSNKKFFVWGIIFSLLRSLTSLLVPLTFSAIVDHALALHKLNLLIRYSLLMIVGYIVVCVAGIGKDYFIAIVDENFIRKSRLLLLEKINRMKFSEYEKMDSGQIMAKYNQEIEVVQEHFGGHFTNVFPNLLILIYCSTYIIFSSVEVLIASLIMIVFYMVINQIFGKKINLCAEENMKDNAESISAFTDYFTNVFLTKIYVLYEKIYSKFKVIYCKYFNSAVKMKLLFSMNINIAMMVLYLSSGIMWYVCGLNIMRGNISIGQLTVIISYQGMLLTPLSFFSEYNGSLKRAMVAIDKMSIFLEMEEENYAGKELGCIRTIEFDNVGFGYGNELVLENVNFKMESGKIYAISGPSGCGKSTIAKLLLRLYECSAGEIRCNGTNIKEYALNMYRLKFAVMSQEPTFYEDSLWGNIFIDADYEIERIIELSKQLDIYDEIQSFSGGFDFLLTQNAGNISGGQKRRIDALRALIKSSDVFIFDEGTNGLDQSRKKTLHDTLKQIKKDKIVVIISHDLEDLRLADVIYTVVDKEVERSC